MRAHPRVCGEHRSSADYQTRHVGSSPRLRGARDQGNTTECTNRLIPASAGSTGGRKPCCMCHWAHPRVCGEHYARTSEPLRLRGSSPRLRGAPSGWECDGGVNGLIPASAGSTLMHWPPPCSAPAHPRVCGEHYRHRSRRMKREGSSPRLRGAPSSRRRTWDWSRLIPASAGSTHSRHHAEQYQTAHPRVCGEHPGDPQTPEISDGSSPRLRGAHVTPTTLPVQRRLIPASAGSTRGASGWGHSRRAHPRVCGEHSNFSPKRSV